MVSEYEKGDVLVIEARTKHATDKDMRSRLLLLARSRAGGLGFFECPFRGIQCRLKGICDPNCPE